MSGFADFRRLIVCMQKTEGGELVKKRILPIILVVIMAVSLCAPAFATPRAAGASVSFYFTGTTANCSATITDSGKRISATLQLWYNDMLVNAWPGSGTTYVAITGTHTSCVSGGVYTLKLVGTIGGVSITSDPIVKTCP